MSADNKVHIFFLCSFFFSFVMQECYQQVGSIVGFKANELITHHFVSQEALLKTVLIACFLSQKYGPIK